MQTRQTVAELEDRSAAIAALAVHGEPVPPLAAVRDRFLEDPYETDLSCLRPVIAGSWHRCVAWQAALDQAPLTLGPDIEQWILDSAEPAVRALLRVQRERGGCVVLGDRFGTVAALRGTPPARAWAEESFAAVGTSLAEDVVGTNCIGTAIEEERGITVAGAEHLLPRLEECWSCSALVRDPLRRSVKAVLALVVPLKNLDSRESDGLAAEVEQAAAEVGDVLTAKLAAREQALLTAYLRQLRKRGARAVMAIDGRTTIANADALELLGPRTQAVLAAYAQEARRARSAIRRQFALDDGAELEVYADPVPWGGEIVGSVLSLRPSASPRATRRECVPGHPFAGLIGDSPLFARTLLHAQRAIERAGPILIVGEAGTGKQAMAAAIARAWSNDRRQLEGKSLGNGDGFRDLEAALERTATVVILRADLAPAGAWAELASLLEVHRSPRLVVTARRLPEPALAVLQASGSMQIEMPTLRARRDDIPALAAAFLAENAAGPQRLSPRLLKTLTETDLPGNVAELREIVTNAASRCSTGEITPDDLTADHRQAVIRTTLPPLQAAEVMQIQEALREADGNRVRAAQILRIGRSTLYRRLEKYSRLGCDL